VILFVIGLWLLVCIVSGMHVLSQFLAAGNGDTMYLKIVMSVITILWISILTVTFLGSLNERFSLKRFKAVVGSWFVLVLIFHFVYTKLIFNAESHFTTAIVNVFDAHLFSFGIGLLGAIPFVLLTLIAKEGK